MKKGLTMSEKQDLELPAEIDPKINCDTMQPSSEVCVLAKGTNSPIGLQEYVLGQILSVIWIACQVMAMRINSVLV